MNIRTLLALIIFAIMMSEQITPVSSDINPYSILGLRKTATDQ